MSKYILATSDRADPPIASMGQSTPPSATARGRDEDDEWCCPGRHYRLRQAARLIIPIWGTEYAKTFKALTLPALLAPGNVPALAERFDVTLVIVTERRLFSAFNSGMPAFCRLKLVAIDDLLDTDYGTVLSRALFRGFSDLGDEMVHTHLFFLNADFIVADGSYRKLADVVHGGARLVCAPSYCMVQENVRERIASRPRLGHRELAKLILENRHNTIRAKTVNDPVFSIHRHDQFYWRIGKDALLGRQMPICVVYFRPERVVEEINTIWDYGVISTFCPTASPVVLGDSDDFLMGELRAREEHMHLLRQGWPTPEEIASDLSTWTTRDQREYGRFPLCLHAVDLPADVERHERDLEAFMARVYAALSPEPVSHVGHQYWNQRGLMNRPALRLMRRVFRKLPFHKAIRNMILGRRKPRWLADLDSAGLS